MDRDVERGRSGAAARGRAGPRFPALLLITAAMVASGPATVPVMAQTAAELAELRAMQAELMWRIEELERRLEQETAARVEVEEQLATEDPGPAVVSGDERVRLAISGQVNRGLMLVGDGEDTTLFNVDNNASSSRIRAIGEARPSDEVLIGSAIEVEFRVNNSFTVSQNDRNTTDTSAFRNRRIEVFGQHDDFGRVWLGQGWTATEGIAERDLSGTAVAGYSDPRVMGGGVFFRDSESGELQTQETGDDGKVIREATTLADVVDNMDGFGRDTRVRYDTPRWNGLQLRTSVVNDGAVDAAVFYEEEIGPVEVDAAFGWANLGDASEDATFDDLFAGSASFLHESGVNLTLAGGTQTRRAAAGDDPVFYYAKLGYQRDFFAFGKTALSVDVHQTNDQQEEGDEARAIGFQFVQNVDDWGMDAFFNFRNHSLERDGRSFDDLNIAMIGARVRF